MDYFLYALEKLLLLFLSSIQKIRLGIRTPPPGFNPPLKLDLGCGGAKKKGFIGIDAILGPGVDIKHNIEEGIPFPDNSVDEIYTSHFLEHVQNRKVPFVLKECARVLKAKGKVRIEVPDLEKSLDKFLKMSEKDKWKKGWEAIFGNQKKGFEYHKTGFTKKRLVRLLSERGFEKITVSSYKRNSIPCLGANATKSMKYN